MKRFVVMSVAIVLATGLGILGVSSGAVAHQRSQHTRVHAHPKVVSLTPNHGSLAGGTIVEIRGSNLVSASAVDFGNTAASFVPRTKHLIQAIAPAGTGTVDVRVTTNTGTSAIVPGDQFSYVSTPVIQGVRPRVGSTLGGNEVTISGADFTNTTAVNFGSTPATNFLVDSPNAITAVAPSHAAGTVDITVTILGGSSSPTDPADKYTFAQNLPVVTSVVFDVGNVAGGEQVTITGKLFLSGATVNFGSAPSASVTVKGSTKITATAPPGAAGTVEVTVQTSNGTSALDPPIDDYLYTTTGP
jgi:large repetitive protein